MNGNPLNPVIWMIFISIAMLILGLVAGYFARHYLFLREKKQGKNEIELLLVQAKEQALEVELQAKDKALQLRQTVEGELSRRRAEVNREDERLQKRREEVDGRADRVEKREQLLNKRQSTVDRRANEIDKMHSQQLEELQRISQMTTEEARTILLSEVEKDTRNDMARIIRQVEAEAREEGDRRARSLIATPIQRVASEHV